MSISIEVDLYEFEEGEIVEYLQDLGYTVTKGDPTEIPPLNVEISDADIFKIKNLPRGEREEYICSLVYGALHLEYLL